MTQLDRKIYPLFTEIAKQTVCMVLQFHFQNTLQDNSSADKNKTNQTSNAFRENEQTLQTQSHTEKGRKKTTKITVPNPHLFDNKQFATAPKSFKQHFDNFSNQSRPE